MTSPDTTPIHPHGSPCQRLLIVIDSAYTLRAIRDRGIESSITYRDLDGYFDRVVSVNPLATASYTASDIWTGRPRVTCLSDRHVFVDVSHHRLGLARWASKLEAFDFALSQISMSWQLIQFARRYEIGVVRGGDPLYSGLMALILARTIGAPCVIRVGGNNEQGFIDTGLPAMPRLFRSRAIERLIEKVVLSNADYVIGANRNNLDFALASGARANRATVIHYGSLLSPEHFTDPTSRSPLVEPFEDLGIGDGEKVLMYVGRLEAVKRPQDLISVMGLLAGEFPSLHLVVVGDGSERQRLAFKAIEAGVEHRVHFVGNQPQSWIARALTRADVVLSPHTGRALAEAALAGAPVVCYDVDWQTEIIEDGVSGVVVAYGDVLAMANATRRLLESRVMARNLGTCLRDRAMKLLDPGALRHVERSIYDRLLVEKDCRR